MDKWKASKSTCLTCPICRSTNLSETPDVIINQLIEDVVEKCKTKGCNVHIVNKNKVKHLNEECKYTKVKCKFSKIGCNWISFRFNKSLHEKHCVAISKCDPRRLFDVIENNDQDYQHY
jgi:hypothetical protein